MSIMVPGFTGSTEVDLPVPLTYDMEIGATRYFAGLDDGEVPLLLLFSGTVFGLANGRMSVTQVPWSKEASYRLPVGVWREAIDAHFPNTAWIKLSTLTFDDLLRFKIGQGTGDVGSHDPASAVGGGRPGGGPGMRLNADHLDHARRVADAILYEGYLLYPYHKAAQKNQVRFQFGVLMPRGYAPGRPERGQASARPSACWSARDDAEVRVLVRFLHLQRRLVQGVSPETGELHDVGTLYVDGTEYTAWDEAAEREQRVAAVVSDLLAGDSAAEFHIGAGRGRRGPHRLPGAAGGPAGPAVGRAGRCRSGCTPSGWPGPYQALKLRLQVENSTDCRWPSCAAATTACGTRSSPRTR